MTQSPERIWLGCQRGEVQGFTYELDAWSSHFEPEPGAEWIEGPHEYVRADLARHLAPGDNLVAQATAALEGVTEGPWEKGAGLALSVFQPHNKLICAETEEDARFIAFTRQWVPEAAARISALTATVAELEREIPRFPDHMAQIVAAKNAGLPDRLQTLIAAIEAIPEHMRQYQWQADAKQAFGSKWVRAIAGDNGKGRGRQAIAEVVEHIDVADYIAAANPDTVSMLISENATLRDRLAKDAKAHEKEIAVWSENYAALERRLGRMEGTMQRAVDGYGQKMRNATDKREKRDWQSMLIAAVDIQSAALTDGGSK